MSETKKGFAVARIFIFFKYVAFAIFTIVSGYISVNMFIGLTEEVVGRTVLIAIAISIEILKIFLLIKANTLLKAGLKKEAFKSYALYALTVSLSLLASFGFNLTLIDRSVKELSAVNSETYIELQGTKSRQNILNTEIDSLGNQIVVFQERLDKIPENFTTAYRETSALITEYFNDQTEKRNELSALTLEITKLETVLAQEKASIRSTANMFTLMAESFAQLPLIGGVAGSDNNLRMILLLIIAILIESGIILTSPSIPIDPEHIEHFLGGDLSLEQLEMVQEHLFKSTKKMSEIKHKEEEFFHPGAEESKPSQEKNDYDAGRPEPEDQSLRDSYADQFEEAKKRIKLEQAMQPYLNKLKQDKIDEKEDEVVVYDSIKQGLKEAVEHVKSEPQEEEADTIEIGTPEDLRLPAKQLLLEEHIDEIETHHDDQKTVPESDKTAEIEKAAENLHKQKIELKALTNDPPKDEPVKQVVKEVEPIKETPEAKQPEPHPVRRPKRRPKRQIKKQEVVETPVEATKTPKVDQIPSTKRQTHAYRFGRTTENVKDSFIEFVKALVPEKGSKLNKVDDAIESSEVVAKLAHTFFRRLQEIKGQGNIPLIKEETPGIYVANFKRDYIISYATAETVPSRVPKNRFIRR